MNLNPLLLVIQWVKERGNECARREHDVCSVYQSDNVVGELSGSPTRNSRIILGSIHACTLCSSSLRVHTLALMLEVAPMMLC